jgi:hypothetical protein
VSGLLYSVDPILVGMDGYYRDSLTYIPLQCFGFYNVATIKVAQYRKLIWLGYIGKSIHFLLIQLGELFVIIPIRL